MFLLLLVWRKSDVSKYSHREAARRRLVFSFCLVTTTDIAISRSRTHKLPRKNFVVGIYYRAKILQFSWFFFFAPRGSQWFSHGVYLGKNSEPNRWKYWRETSLFRSHMAGGFFFLSSPQLGKLSLAFIFLLLASQVWKTVVFLSLH